MPTTSHETVSSTDPVGIDDVRNSRDLRSALLRSKPANLALQRLKARLLKDADPSEAITSYDRMHHRHNRS